MLLTHGVRRPDVSFAANLDGGQIRGARGNRKHVTTAATVAEPAADCYQKREFSCLRRSRTTTSMRAIS